MCIRDRLKDRMARLGAAVQQAIGRRQLRREAGHAERARRCLLYTSDAADERSSVDLGGRRIIKKKQHTARRSNRRERIKDIPSKHTRKRNAT